MSETIELTDKDLECGPQATFFGWFLMEALGEYHHKSNCAWIFGPSLEINLTINGNEIPLRPVVDEIEKNLERLVHKRAEELIRNKLSEVRDAVESIDFQVRKVCRDLRVELKVE